MRRGSSSLLLFTFAEIAQLVEHNLAKVGVASSSLVFRSQANCSKSSSLFFFLNPILRAPCVRFLRITLCFVTPTAFAVVFFRENMNIYVRYFDNEALVRNLDELFDFLSGLGDITINKMMVDELTNYVNDEANYPKRYKVRPRVYFILIKTTAQTLEEFKANNRSAQPSAMAAPYMSNMGGIVRKDSRVYMLQEERNGWYLGRINFKRVLLIPGTQKFQYRDTTFAAYVFTSSAMECYNRIVSHLKNRQDIDPRSQFPSAKGSNFTYEFFGERLPE